MVMDLPENLLRKLQVTPGTSLGSTTETPHGPPLRVPSNSTGPTVLDRSCGSSHSLRALGASAGQYAQSDFCFPFTELVEAIHQYYVPIMIFLGMIGNLLSCFVFLNTHLRVRSSSSYYLAALAIADFGFQAMLVLVWINSVLGYKVFDEAGWCEGTTYVSGVCGFMSVWLIVAFTVERYVAVRYPLHRRHMCTARRAKSIIAGITAFAVVLHLYAFKTRGVVRDKDGNERCRMLEEHSFTLRLINLADAVLTVVLPTVVIIVMNTVITRNLVLSGRRFNHGDSDNATTRWTDAAERRESAERSSGPDRRGSSLTPATARDLSTAPKVAESLTASTAVRSSARTMSASAPVGPNILMEEISATNLLWNVAGKQQRIRRSLVYTRPRHSITKMLLLISTVFVFLNLPSHVFRVYASITAFMGDDTDPSMSPLMAFGQQVAMLLYYTNFSINFLLYSVTGRTFRRSLNQLVRRVAYYFGCDSGTHRSESQFSGGHSGVEACGGTDMTGAPPARPPHKCRWMGRKSSRSNIATPGTAVTTTKTMTMTMTTTTTWCSICKSQPCNLTGIDKDRPTTSSTCV